MALPRVRLGREFLILVIARWKVTFFCLIGVSEATSFLGLKFTAVELMGAE